MNAFNIVFNTSITIGSVKQIEFAERLRQKYLKGLMQMDGVPANGLASSSVYWIECAKFNTFVSCSEFNLILKANNALYKANNFKTETNQFDSVANNSFRLADRKKEINKKKPLSALPIDFIDLNKKSNSNIVGYSFSPITDGYAVIDKAFSLLPSKKHPYYYCSLNCNPDKSKQGLITPFKNKKKK